MHSLTTLLSLPERRPGHWPHAGAEADLPGPVRHDLDAAAARLAPGTADVSQALPLVERAVALARHDPTPDVLARCLHTATTLVLRAGRPLRAYELGLEAQTLLERQDDRWRATLTLLARALCCIGLDEHERGRGLAEEALHRFEGLSDQAGVTLCEQVMAEACEAGLDPAAGLRHAGRALALCAGPPAQRAALAELCARLHLQHGAALAAAGDVGAGAGDTGAGHALAQARRLLARHPPDAARGQPGDAHRWRTRLLLARADADLAAEHEAARRLACAARRFGGPGERGLAWLGAAERRQRHGQGDPAQAGRPCQRALAALRRALRLLPPDTEPALHLAARRLEAQLREAQGDLAGAYQAMLEAGQVEQARQRQVIAARAELRLLDLSWEQERRRSEQTLAYAQRLSNVGHLVASVNHELNQPMASIRLLADTAIALIEQGETAEPAANLRSMHRISEHLSDVATKLAAFPASATVPPRQVPLHLAVDEALALLYSRLAQTPCTIERRLGDECVWAHAGQLERVIANLVNNALDVLAHLAEPRIVFSSTHQGGQVVLRVSDNGPGLPAAVQARLFQPFVSTKPAGVGLGLGLAMSRQVMQEMGGDLRAVATGDEGGATFEIILPAAAADAEPKNPAASRTGTTPGGDADLPEALRHVDCQTRGT